MVNDKTVTASEMKEIEKRANEGGLSYYQMMENAGRAASQTISDEFPYIKSLIVFCGKGNNGGDGFVVARLFANEGMKVCVILVEGNPVTEDAKTNFDKLPPSVEIFDLAQCGENKLEELFLQYKDGGIIVDAIYGTGFHGKLREDGFKACRLIKSSGMKVVSLDLPSGCNCDTLEVADGAIEAYITTVFDSFKNIHVSGIKNIGKCVLEDIGIPKCCH